MPITSTWALQNTPSDFFIADFTPNVKLKKLKSVSDLIQEEHENYLLKLKDKYSDPEIYI